MVWRICKNLDTPHLFASCLAGMGQYEADIHRCVPEWDLCDLYIFIGLDLYDLQDLYELQDLYDLPEWNLCDLHDMYILTGMRSVRFAGSV